MVSHHFNVFDGTLHTNGATSYWSVNAVYSYNGTIQTYTKTLINKGDSR